MASSFMKNQIEFPFRGGSKGCTHRNRRAQWARLWFTRMHEVVAEAGEQAPPDKHEQNQPAHWPGKK
jgi:hypothetical protein